MADETVDNTDAEDAGVDETDLHDDVFEEEYVDELPDDLNAADFVGPYLLSLIHI